MRKNLGFAVCFSILLCGGLAGCGSGPDRVGQYQPTVQTVDLDLGFAPGSAELSADDRARIATLVPLPAGASAKLMTGKVEARSRADAVSYALGATVQAYIAPWPEAVGQRKAVLAVTMRKIVAEACDDRPVRFQDSLWPMLPDTGKKLLPAGCAMNSDLAAMMDRPSDLFYGRPLAPADAQPFIDAANRYETRNQYKPPYGSNWQTPSMLSDTGGLPSAGFSSPAAGGATPSSSSGGGATAPAQ